jgi:phage terminase large subunit GpA-like protein
MNDARFILSQYDNMTTEPPPSSICGWIEARRVLPSDSPIPGYYKFNRTPYQAEIVENLGPYSPVINTVILKSRKVGMTTAVDGAIGFWIGAWPTSIIYATATEALTKQYLTENLLPVIESCGLNGRLIAPFSNARNKKNAVTSKHVEFQGGHIDLISSGSTDARRQKNCRVLVLDEVDGLPEMTTTGEGSFIEILKGHQMSWGARRKFCAFSSPTTFEQSAIWKLYSQYDERKFLIPCPICGRHIELVDADDEANYGLKADTQGGKIKDVYYLCPYCNDVFHNKDKTIFYSDNPYCKRDPRKKIELAHWQATKSTDDPASRSYSINSLYSPIGAMTWTDVYKAKIKAREGGADGLRSYVNLYLGLPFRDTGQRPKVDRVIELRGEYKSGTVPNEVVLLTGAVDVQRGSEKDEKNPPRLEMEVMGTCPGKQSYSILYKVFEGAIEDPYGGAWEKLRQFQSEGGLQFTRADGQELEVMLIGIDSGYLPDVVYRFCESWRYTLPVKGFGLLRADYKKKEKGDIPGGLKRYRAAKIGNSIRLLEINTAYYKESIYNRLKIERQPGSIQKNGFCGFPYDYPDEYFFQLCGEEKRVDGSFHAIRERVEALDVRVYNEALADYFLELQVQEWRAWYTAHKGWNMSTLNSIDKLFVLNELQKNPSKFFEISLY